VGSSSSCASRGIVAGAAAAVGSVSGAVGRRAGGIHCARDCDHRDCGTGGGRRGAGMAIDVLLQLLVAMVPSSVVTLVPGGRVGAVADAGGRISRRAMSGLSGLS